MYDHDDRTDDDFLDIASQLDGLPEEDDDWDESREDFHNLMDSVHLDETFIDPLIDADRLRTLRTVLAAIEDPGQRKGGVGWETARDIVQRMIDASPEPEADHA
jgi:hypothetical protein